MKTKNFGDVIRKWLADDPELAERVAIARIENAIDDLQDLARREASNENQQLRAALAMWITADAPCRCEAERRECAVCVGRRVMEITEGNQ